MSRFARFAASLLLCLPGILLAAVPQLATLQARTAAMGNAPGVHSQAAPMQLNSNALRSLPLGAAIEFTLPNGHRHPIVFEAHKPHGGGIDSWVGYHQEKGRNLRTILTVGPTGTFGVVETPEGEFRIVPGQGHDWLIDMNAEKPFLPVIDLRDDVRIPPQTKSLPENDNAPSFLAPVPGVDPVPEGAANLKVNAVVDLMIVYTQGLANALGSNLMTRLNFLVTRANTAYSDSLVPITMRLVNATMVNYVDNTDDTTALNSISPGAGGGSGVFANIETIRASVGADAVSFMRNGQGFGGSGLAFVPSPTYSSGFMYSTLQGCVLGCEVVFIHEVGHNMGNMHDRATVSWQTGSPGKANGAVGFPQGAFSYSYGYAYCQSGPTCNMDLAPGGGGCSSQPQCSGGTHTNDFATIMAYFQNTTTQSYRFSNPNITCGPTSQPCGVDPGVDAAHAAYDASSMDNTKASVSGVKATVLANLPGSLQFTAAGFTGTEGGNVTLTVSRVGGSSGAVSVNYAASSATAFPLVDFTGGSGTLNWADGDAADKTITIPLVNDNVTEGNEAFTVTLSNPAGATGVYLGFPTTATAFILEAWPPGGTFPAGFVTPDGSSGSWTVASDKTYEGGFSLRSAQVNNSGSIGAALNSDLSITTNFQPGTISFAYNVSSYPSYGVFNFIIDGATVFTDPGGETGWVFYSGPITAGSHKVTWRFNNAIGFPCNSGFTPPPPGGAACADRVWLDAVVLPLAGTAPNITSAAPPGGSVSVAYNFTYTATGSPTPSFLVTAGALPGGLTLNGASGALTGTPTGPGTFTGTVTASNSSGVSSQPFSINVSGAATAPGSPTIGTALPGNGLATINFTAPASDGGSPITSYTATCNPGGITGSGAASPITVNALANGTPYTCSVTATNAIGTGPASGTVGVTPSASAVSLVAVQSRKTHGVAGTFDFLIDSTVLIGGNVTVEPRQAQLPGSTHQIVFQFNGPITAAGTPACVDKNAAPVGSAVASFSGNEVAVTLTGIPDNQRVTVSLANVNGIGVNASASMGFLVGDVNNSRSVSAADILAVKFLSGFVVGAGNFQYDVNTNGGISAADILAVKFRSGTTLAP